MDSVTVTTGDVIRGAESIYRAAKELEKCNFILGIARSKHLSVKATVQEAELAADAARSGMREEIRDLAELIPGPDVSGDPTADDVSPEASTEAPV